MLGRSILLRACDPFTRTFYSDELGLEQPEPVIPDIPAPASTEVHASARKLAISRLQA